MDEIYLNLDDHEFSEVSSFSKEGIREEMQKQMHELTKPKNSSDLRPRVWCSRTKTLYLLDSGAAVSVIPRSAWPVRSRASDVSEDSAVSLKAVNGSAIKTYGSETLRL